MMKFVGIVGSNAELSYNRKLLHFIKDHYSDMIDLDIVEIDNIPLFNQDNVELTIEGPIHTINRKILQSDGVIIATPEHNHTIPAGLSSLLEWLSFDIHPLRNKPVLIVGASYLNQGTSRSQLHLRQILEAPGIDAMTMPGDEFLLSEAKEAFNAQDELKDPGTVKFLGSVIEKFIKYAKAIQNLKVDPQTKEEDLSATKGTDTTIEGVDKSDPNWVEIAAEKVNAVSGDTYVKLDRGILTVDQLNWFLQTIPLELTYADENNQYLYYNRHMPGEEMCASRFEDQVGSDLGSVHPPHTFKNVSWVISQLRSGNMDSVHVHVPIHQDRYVVHNYQAMHDEDGKYRGINEYVLDLEPVINWYLEQTGYELVKPEGVDANSSASVGGAWGTDDPNETDQDSGASATEDDYTVDTDADSGASEW